MKKAFTLVEMLVVIAILGILTGVLIMQFGGISERSKVVKCATNIKNLAAAAGIHAMGGAYPHAQSHQYMYAAGGDALGIKYGHCKGWISWNDKDAEWPGESERSFTQCSYASTDEDAKLYCITNGAIWTAVGMNRSSYLCPVHAECCHKAGIKNPGWSYVMNARFGYESAAGKANATSSEGITSGQLNRADRVLMFAEIPALMATAAMKNKYRVNELPSVNLTGGDGDSAMDACLVYRSLAGNSGEEESIGFNHIQGKTVVGHVAFADGHVESITVPRSGNFNELTDWLCQGRDVVYNNGSYDEIKDNEVE